MNSDKFEKPELVDEYLRSLQEQIDHLTGRNERLADRVAKLESERETLRGRLPRRKRPTSSSLPAEPILDGSIDIPVVGTIPDLELPEENPSRPGLKVAVVLDPFSRAAFGHEFKAIDVSARTWKNELEKDEPDLLLVESAYRGVDGSWGGRVARFGEPSLQLAELVEWCRQRRIPTVFWNKEDPINHDWFIASASLFDWVLTVDSNMLDAYRRRLGNRQVEVLQFAAQPAIHHPPTDESIRTGRIGFAGSYFANKHRERREQMEMLLDPAISEGLQIFDRMDRPVDPRFTWPEKYRESIVGSLTYAQTLEVYRRFDTFLNVNTVVVSPTMCARRVYELLASGTRVISGPAEALSGVPVHIVDSSDAAIRAMHRETPSPQEGLEWVAAGNLMSHRVDKIMELLAL